MNKNPGEDLSSGDTGGKEEKISRRKSKGKDNPMREIRLGKVVLNIGTSTSEEKLKKAVILLKRITPMTPVKCLAKKRLAGFNIRPGIPIGCKVTLRGKDAEEMLPRLLAAKDNILKEKNFDNEGNFAFGIDDYIDIEDVEYDPAIKVMGLEATVSLERPGFRIKKRRLHRSKIPMKHRIRREDTMNYVKNRFGVKVVER